MIIIISLAACKPHINPENDELLDKYLPEFATKFSFIGNGNNKWLLKYGYALEKDVELNIEVKNDSTYQSVKLIQYPDVTSGEIHFEAERWIVRYYDLKRKNTLIRYENSQIDTLYEFDVEKNFDLQSRNLNEINFISGKYRYMADEFFLTECQQNFYLMHKDSLNRIKGNFLRDLPCK